MTIDEMDLVGELKEVEPLRTEAYEQARAALRTAIANEQRTPLVAARSARSGQAAPQVGDPEHGGRRYCARRAVALFAVFGADPALTSHAPAGSTHAAVGKVERQADAPGRRHHG